MSNAIPSVYEGPFGFVTEIHWNYHAWLMFATWAVLVPAIVLITRFAKPAPTPYGSISRPYEPLVWFVLHRYGLFVCMVLSTGGGLVAVIVSLGFSASLHSFFGVATVVLGLFQVAVAALRGSRGGKYGADGTLNDEATWRGDHYDMTPQRRWFEAVHKQVGYFTLAMALGAIATGLAQYWIPEIGMALAVVICAALVSCIVLEGTGRRHDTYHSYYGNHPDHPYNRQRGLPSAGGSAAAAGSSGTDQTVGIVVTDDSPLRS